MTLQQKSDMIQTLQNTKAWLDNLERIVGNENFMDVAPNNWGGRIDMMRQINVLKAELERLEK